MKPKIFASISSALLIMFIFSAFYTPITSAYSKNSVVEFAASSQTDFAVQKYVKNSATVIYYRRGYSLQGTWFCYGWPAFYRCTQHWHVVNGKVISDNTSWVPNNLGENSLAPNNSAGSSTSSGSSFSSVNGLPCHDKIIWPTTITQWTIPSGCYSRIYYPNVRNYPARPSYGFCNWWPEELNQRYSGSTVLHLTRYSTPRIGAVIWFNPYTQGASGDGHYAEVIAIHGNWLLITEMNFYWRGGGFGRVDFRFIHTGYGVSFMYP